MQSIYSTTLQEDMSAQEIKAKTDAANTAFQQRTEDLACSGALHDQAFKIRAHADPGEMQGELNRLRADAVNGQSQSLSTPALPQTFAKTNIVNEQRQVAGNGTLDTGSAQTDLHHGNLPALDKQGMRRWHAETVFHQPWNPFRHIKLLHVEDSTRAEDFM